jgi:hypothetical protein
MQSKAVEAVTNLFLLNTPALTLSQTILPLENHSDDCEIAITIRPANQSA